MPVKIHGKPIADLPKTGGWIAAFLYFCIFDSLSIDPGNEMAERMAYFGLSVNMVAFVFYVMHRPFSSSSNAVNNFPGISQASSVLGGFLADAYLCRYWTIAIFTAIYLAGLIGVTLCASMKIFLPDQDQCDQLSLLLGSCETAKPWQMLYLYTVLYITAFGVDLFDEGSKDYITLMDRFFNFYYLCVTIGAIVAFTLVAGSIPLTRVAQVLVAAFEKRHVPFTKSELVGLYELPGRHSAVEGSGKIPHTDDFRKTGGDPSPWRLYTVTQVEEVNILIELIPIPACTIMLNTILTEFLNTLDTADVYLEYSQGKIETPYGRIKFFYKEAPDAMKSKGSAYAALAGGLSCFVASIINSIVKSVTMNPDNK
ncbi:Protein NRT1/ PTR FAMILY 6.1 [Hibiscus syriacus]|uniref:Protein NRT1/ PTR FAMILY 6.1 n=1 Tax=Hibiscus syriacus TaxID=106335 RepID=A0A6A3CT25_HIBSY|nr:Protein NRT1/ PTR FAMILY 6.1 [Hibiscus syriacus]